MTKDAKLKSMLVSMLEWFHNFCVENHLIYYVAGGTMLGAVRHQGFIPWDDDVDVVMPREDYNRLSELMKVKEDERYCLETPETAAEDYVYPFSKLYDKETTLIENTRYKTKRGIYIDIFPLDGFGMTEEESKRNYKKVNRLHNLLLLKVTGIRNGRSLYKNVAVMLFKMMPLSSKRILRKLVCECERISWKDSLWGGNPVGAWRFNEIMPKDVMGIPQLYKFESIEVYGAENADAYLSSLYGDWRTLPPQEKRVSHHDYIELNLEKSYLE